MEINGKRAYKLPDKNIVCFYWAPRKNEVQSQNSGAAVYDQVLMAEIYSPGYKTQVHRPEIEVKFANGSVRARNSGYRDPDSGRDITWREYLGVALDAWEKDKEAPDNGTPLETWPKLDVAQVAALREAKIYSIEMLADLPDSRLDIIPLGGRVLRDQAQAFLDAAKGNAQTDHLIARNAELEERMKRMESQFDAIKLAEKNKPVDGDVDQTEPKRGPGRPPKNAAA